MTEFNRNGFRGVVYLQEWIKHRDGRQYIGVAGRISILSDTELLGFKVKGTETNWCARVEGKENAMNILGCQVRAVEVTDDLSGPMADVLVVQ